MYPKLSTAALLALLLSVYGAPYPAGDPLSEGSQGSVTNARQTMDTLTRQLQSHNGHPTADTIGAFITGADSQIDNGIATISGALGPDTGGMSQMVGNTLLGPFAQATTNGAEVLASNIAGAPIDAALGPALGSYTQNLSKLSSLASKNNVDVSRLNKAITKIQSEANRKGVKFPAHHKRELGHHGHHEHKQHGHGHHRRSESSSGSNSDSESEGEGETKHHLKKQQCSSPAETSA